MKTKGNTAFKAANPNTTTVASVSSCHLPAPRPPASFTLSMWCHSSSPILNANPKPPHRSFNFQASNRLFYLPLSNLCQWPRNDRNILVICFTKFSLKEYSNSGDIYPRAEVFGCKNSIYFFFLPSSTDLELTKKLYMFKVDNMTFWYMYTLQKSLSQSI